MAHDDEPVATGPPVRPRGPLGLLAGLSPEAFEAWVGDRLREAGSAVRATPLQGDHGADLLATRDGGLTVVQCKHPPGRAVGVPVELDGLPQRWVLTRRREERELLGRDRWQACGLPR